MQYRFTPTFFLTAFCIVLFILFASLGTWQVNRVGEKQQQQATINALTSQPPTELNRMPLPTITPYQRAVVTGTFRPEEQFLLDNIILDGKPGFYVITPFSIKGSHHSILVNRGWVSQGKSRQQLPIVPPPSGETTLSGTLATPRSKPVILGNAESPLSNQPSLWFYMDLAFFQASVSYSVLPLVLRLDPAHTETTDAINRTTTLTRQWPTFDAKTGMHIGYAIQWFVFALFVLFAFVGMSTKKTSVEGSPND